ncbi:hypothetical protein ACHAWF_010421 [Thalassiosira exigua]
MSRRNWCDTCRGDGAEDDVLLRCASCPRRFHKECAGLRVQPEKGWECPHCVAEEAEEPRDDGGGGKAAKAREKGKNAAKKRIAAVRKCHRELQSSSREYLEGELREHLVPFASDGCVEGKKGPSGSGKAATSTPIALGPSPAFVNATLRPYQVTGVNFLLQRYALGTGCIVADEMGLGKTIQSLSFLAALKDGGLPGPHLVVTPFAVLQNWANEMKRFTPGMSFIKIHGGLGERDRLMSRDDVVRGEFDVYLTTYDTYLSEEAFFTETFLFNTVIIDEGHRLKNVHCKLCKGLARLSSPFRVLLTGTPLQNNLAELVALLNYILPSVALREDLPISAAENKSLDRRLVSQARTLLEQCMIRRIKAEVESSLLPKIEYVLKPPLTGIQRKWYRSFLEADNDTVAKTGMLTKEQLMRKVLQCGKVANHPKTLVLTYDRERKRYADMVKRAQGSMFIKVDKYDAKRTPEAIAREEELRGLVGEKLVSSCGKLALLDRLLLAKKAEGSRVLIFSQYTLTLDVIEEYVKFRFGAMGSAYLRLDGTTGRIQREMDMRSFNKPGCAIFCYLISTRAGGQGINLATANTVVLYDTCWNPQVDLQAQDRAHRIGQKKQVVIYRMISSNTVEERVLARARQKMVLDALVIKQRGSDGMADMLADQDSSGEEDGEMAKLSVDELWKMLSEGADMVFDPAQDDREDYASADYDRLISEAEPAKWDDKTSGYEKPSAASVEGSNLDGTIFSKRKVGRPKKTEIIDLLSSGNESESSAPGAVDTSYSDNEPDVEKGKGKSIFDTVAVSTEFVGGRRRGKRTRVAPPKFVANYFESNSKKKPKIAHDSTCFCCRRFAVKPPNAATKNGKAPFVDPNAPLECIACPRVYHMKCSGERNRPKTRSWYCPWHACVTCKHKKTDAGGTLFHCMECPLTYCFDCAPDEYTEGGQSTSAAALELLQQLERKNMPSTKNMMFFTCRDCKARKGPLFPRQNWMFKPVSVANVPQI